MAHELGHVLGFNSEAFRYMRDEQGNPRTIRERNTNEPILTDDKGYRIPDKSVLSYVTRVWRSAKTTVTRYLTALKTPMMLKKAREYFACERLEGVELDNNQPLYVRGHFSKRLIDNELMTPVLSSRSYISSITLGFFEDTGWYQVDYSLANPMGYGKYLGCNFVMKSCYEYMEIQKHKYATSKPFTGTANTYSYCNTPEKESEVQPKENYMLHYFGNSSMCINHDSTRDWLVIHEHDILDVSSPKSSCMKHICTEKEGLILILGDKELVCPLKGKYIDLLFRGSYFSTNGSIICPPCRDICKVSRSSYITLLYREWNNLYQFK
ncbi:Leishmanolysin-like peptidase [Schistosoma japonicum]|nr:Leishmanolysin-like peptidase [Schistosoma japonicum]